MGVLEPFPARGLPLAAENLRVMTLDDRILLDVPRLEVGAGQSLAIQGPSGAGKSTLLHVLSGLVPPTTGRVSWGRTDLTALTDTALAAFRRRSVDLVFQDFLLFEELDAADNAALATGFVPRRHRPALRQCAEGWLERLGLASARAQTTSVLSGGERQRVAVARALACDPAVILADEPTASLDRANADMLADDLFAITRDTARTLIVVTHDDRFAGRMDRRLVLSGGRIVADSND